MRTYYFIVISVLLVVFGVLLYPTIHLVVGFVDTTGFLPLTKAATIALPYIFLAFIGWAIFQMKKR